MKFKREMLKSVWITKRFSKEKEEILIIQDLEKTGFYFFCRNCLHNTENHTLSYCPKCFNRILKRLNYFNDEKKIFNYKTFRKSLIIRYNEILKKEVLK